MAKVETIEDYIAKYEGTYAHPILRRLDEIIREEVPGLTTAIKWGSPSYEYKGLMITTVAFKNFTAAWFHKGVLLDDPAGLLEASSESTKSMRKYILKSADELKEEAFRELVRDAVRKNEKGEEVSGMGETRDRVERSEMLEQALAENPLAEENYNKLSDHKKREYAEHIELAKQQSTKQRRLKKSLQLLEQGKGLNDKYRK